MHFSPQIDQYKHVIFYGPGGCGKSYLAGRLAACVLVNLILLFCTLLYHISPIWSLGIFLCAQANMYF